MLPSEPSTSAAGIGFDEPLDMLLSCHQKVLRFCGQIDKLPHYVAEHGVNPAVVNTCQGILRYFDVAGPLHHADEERDLFPVLAERAPDCKPLLTEISIEHITLEGMWHRLREQLQALADGNVAALDTLLSEAFTARYRDHIYHEETTLIPLGRLHLTAAELAALGESMTTRRTD